jgi:hypothetical protein
MIVANMATYPPRREGAVQAVMRLAPQVDRLNLVLNQYSDPLEELTAFSNVNQIIPDDDTKDTGKFYPKIDGAEYVILTDDDLIFPSDFVARTLRSFQSLGSGYMGGYHASLYQKPRFSFRKRGFLRWFRYSDDRIADYRRVIAFYREQTVPVIVDQVATNAAVMRAQDFPPFEFMRTSQKFVDVRLARWCFERQIVPVALPKPSNWIESLRYDETIFESFTKTNPSPVSREILSYAFKVPGRGTSPRLANRLS